MKGKVNEELKKHFKPEFLNRVDDTIVFPQLSTGELMQIVDLFVKRLADRMLDRDMTVEMSDDAKRALIKIGYDPALGARPAAPRDAARGRGPAVRADPAGRAQGGRPRQGRPRRHRVHVRRVAGPTISSAPVSVAPSGTTAGRARSPTACATAGTGTDGN